MAEMNEIMETLKKNTHHSVLQNPKPSKNTWSLPDLFIRQYKNNYVFGDGFGLKNVEEMYNFLLSKKETLKRLGMIRRHGWNNCGYPLWINYDFDRPISSYEKNELKALLK